MNALTTLGALLAIFAIVFTGVKTETKIVNTKVTPKATDQKPVDRIPAAPEKIARPKKKRVRKFVQSLTDPKSKHARLVGKKMDLATPGKWTVVHFWATWCGSCVEASPHLVQLHEKYAPLGVEFFGVNLDKEPEAMSNYMEKVGITWPQMVTKEGWQSSVRKQYKIPSIPAILLVTPDGIIIEAGMKEFDDASKRLRHHLPRKLSGI